MKTSVADTASDVRSDQSQAIVISPVGFYSNNSGFVFWYRLYVLHDICLSPFLQCSISNTFIYASIVLGQSTNCSLSPELWYVHFTLFFLLRCCWLGSVLGSTCPQNEYTFACISALLWLACYPLCRRVWLMIWVCHFSRQPSRPPAWAHIKHQNTGEKKNSNFIFHNKNNMFPSMDAMTASKAMHVFPHTYSCTSV